MRRIERRKKMKDPKPVPMYKKGDVVLDQFGNEALIKYIGKKKVGLLYRNGVIFSTKINNLRKKIYG